MLKNDDKNQNTKNVYDDGDIPKVDMPRDKTNQCVPNGADYTLPPLPESSRPRQDGPGGA